MPPGALHRPAGAPAVDPTTGEVFSLRDPLDGGRRKGSSWSLLELLLEPLQPRELLPCLLPHDAQLRHHASMVLLRVIEEIDEHPLFLLDVVDHLVPLLEHVGVEGHSTQPSPGERPCTPAEGGSGEGGGPRCDRLRPGGRIWTRRQAPGQPKSRGSLPA